jgi:hypothetical protein
MFEPINQLATDSLGIAQVAKKSRKGKRHSDRTYSGGQGGRSSGRSSGSSRSAKCGGMGYEVSDRKLSNRSDAAAWGRLGAVLGIGIDNIADAVEVEFWAIAQGAYEKKMQAAGKNHG